MVKKRNFEQASERIEEIINVLEKGEIPLDELLKIYKEGVELITFCNKELEKASLSIEEIAIN